MERCPGRALLHFGRGQLPLSFPTTPCLRVCGMLAQPPALCSQKVMFLDMLCLPQSILRGCLSKEENTASFWRQQSCDHGPGPLGSELISREVIGFLWRHRVFQDRGWTRFFLPGRHLVLNQDPDAPTSCLICLNHWVNGLFTDMIISPGKHASHPGWAQLLRARAVWIPEFPTGMAKTNARHFRPNM